jgi:hypothetical protein
MRIDDEILERLRMLSCITVGGYTRIVEDCLRIYLPFFEYQSELEQQGNFSDVHQKLATSLMRPEYLGQALAVALEEIVKQETKSQGKRKP